MGDARTQLLEGEALLAGHFLVDVPARLVAGHLPLQKLILAGEVSLRGAPVRGLESLGARTLASRGSVLLQHGAHVQLGGVLATAREIGEPISRGRDLERRPLCGLEEVGLWALVLWPCRVGCLARATRLEVVEVILRGVIRHSMGGRWLLGGLLGEHGLERSPFLMSDLTRIGASAALQLQVFANGVV